MRFRPACSVLMLLSCCARNEHQASSARPEAPRGTSAPTPSTTGPTVLAPTPTDAAAASAAPLSTAEREILKVALESFGAVKNLVAQGKLVDPNGVDAEMTCTLILRSLPRYREARDPDAQSLLADAPRVCGMTVPVMSAKDALKESPPNDGMACLMSDDALLEAEFDFASEPSVKEARAQWDTKCAAYDRLAAIDGWLDTANDATDKYGLSCSMSDERLARLERVKFRPSATGPRRERWSKKCKKAAPSQ